MFTFEPGSTRSTLGFAEAVRGSFEFLHQYGFACVRSESTLVRYESERRLTRKGLFVDVFHGRGSYLLGVEIGVRNSGEAPITLPEIVESAGGEEAEEFGERTTFQVSSREGVQECVSRLADIVRKYAAPFLQGDRRAYKSAFQHRRRRAGHNRRMLDLTTMRRKADEAWRARSYAEVVKIYERFEKDLTRSERLRLGYARKKAG